MMRVGAGGCVLALALGACGGGSGGTKSSTAARRADAWAKDWSGSSGDATTSGGGSSKHVSREAVPAAGGTSAYGATDGAVPNQAADPALQAGNVDDNAKWEDYLVYRDKSSGSGVKDHDVDITNRRVVRVVDRKGKPVLGAHVELRSGEASLMTRTTYADGRALVYPPKSSGQGSGPSFTLRVTLGDTSVDAPLDEVKHDQTVPLDVDSAHAQRVPLDVLFLIDATGSMGDEIEQLKANMVTVSEQIAKLDTSPDVRFGMTVFRDRGDAFVTRTFDFTGDVDSFVAALRAVVADGGGDTPESVNQGLHDALTQAHWRGDDAVKMVFLVGDAAPHLDYAHDSDYAVEMQHAAERGIKIDPIASSGLDDQGEYVFRQLAQYTTGRFNFLTYGADGHSPGTSTPHHVTDYSVLSLDQLVVNLVKDELATRS